MKQKSNKEVISTPLNIPNSSKKILGVFSPSFLYLAGFVLPFLLVFVGFSKEVPVPNEKTLEVVFSGIASFYLGIFLVYILFRAFNSAFPLYPGKIGHEEVVIQRERSLFIFLFGLWLVGILMLWYEFSHLGALPLLSSSPETLRFQLQVSGYIHLLAISSGFVVFVFFALSQISKSVIYKKIYLLIIFITLISLLMTANRMDFLYPVFLMVLFYIFYNGVIFSKKLIFLLLSLLVVFVVVNIIRSCGYDENYIQNIYFGLGENFDPNALNIAIYPLYMTLTYGFEMLNKLVEDGVSGVTDGLYTFYAFYSLLPGHQEDFGEFKNNILNIDFYAELTSTYLSNFYVDYGIKAVWGFSAIYGAVVQVIWELTKKSKKMILLYVVIAGPILFLFYAFYYVYFYAFFQLAIVSVVIMYIRKRKIMGVRA